jgi:uncharacterized Fe-S cluster-containing MiaB family protein
MGSRRQASNRFLQLTFVTLKPLFLSFKNPLQNLPFAQRAAKKIGGGLEVSIVLSTVWRLRSAVSLANMLGCVFEQ